MATYAKGQVISASRVSYTNGVLNGYAALFQADASPSATYFKGDFYGATGAITYNLVIGPTSNNFNTDRAKRYTFTTVSLITPAIYFAAIPGTTTLTNTNYEYTKATTELTARFGYHSDYGLYVPPDFYVYIHTSGVAYVEVEMQKIVISQG